MSQLFFYCNTARPSCISINIKEPTLRQTLVYWQGLQDDYRTYCGVISFSEEGQGDA